MGRGRDRRHLYPGRQRRIAPTFTDAEYADIAAAGTAAGVTPTGFCAEAALSAARGVRSPVLDQAREMFSDLQVELFDARVALGRIGTNLNQAMAALNATGEAPDWLERVVALCERRMQHLDGVIARLDRRLP
ncbi:hypothetical protein Pa4123_62070 [Phytohabitans aurantiacus]|uniref:Bacterial mobilisation domain-containing protein n=2 Tax=Phytohabitans aurantiacus TaxID=3016789 RepID=A0ABQ5R2H7_9ACTN|nr:hypothetical protein Pa4123_62070 [Phytohabitans aurantiacus]